MLAGLLQAVPLVRARMLNIWHEIEFKLGAFIPRPRAGHARGRQATVLADLRTRVQSVQQEMRRRLRERETRMGIDPRTPDHVVDAAEQQLEKAVERVATMIGAAQDAALARDPVAQAAIVRSLHEATRQIEQAVARVDTIFAAADQQPEARAPRGEVPVGELDRATQKVDHAVERVESVMASTPAPSATREPGESATIAASETPPRPR